MKTEICDVLIIGSGGAGLCTAIELHDRKKKVLVVGKCKKREAHTMQAQGGINAALGNMDKKDSWQLHAADTIADGGYINDAAAVELLCKNAPDAVNELAKWGTKFHREKNGNISQRFFGAATYRRACFSGDVTGKEILNTLVDQVLQLKIGMKSEMYIFSLLTSGGIVNGALGLHMPTGTITAFHAKAVVLATGGHSRAFARSSSHFWENNGDGIALAKSVGAEFIDMEMFQFHPTGMVWPKNAAGLLVTEAVRGEGGILTNSKGKRFVEELSARDVVARAIWKEITSGRGTKRGGVYLDISHQSLSYLKKRLPTMVQRFKKFCKVDISKQKMEVAPTAHYSMGGIRTNHATGETGVEGLYALGEVTGGMHGGNRLGGNSLAEIVVFGRLVGKNLASTIKKISLLPLDQAQISSQIDTIEKLCSTKAGSDPIKIKEELQQMMWEHAGVVRDGKTLNAGIKKLKTFQSKKLQVTGSLKNNQKLIAALDIANMIPTSEMILESAILRKESRAAHFRSDFPKSSKLWEKNIVISPSGIKKESVKKPSSAVQKQLKWREKHKQSSELLE